MLRRILFWLLHLKSCDYCKVVCTDYHTITVVEVNEDLGAVTQRFEIMCKHCYELKYRKSTIGKTMPKKRLH